MKREDVLPSAAAAAVPPQGAAAPAPTLRLLLALVFSLLALTATALSLAVVQQRATGEIERAIGGKLAELAHQTASRLDRSMYERYREVALAAHRLGGARSVRELQTEVDDLQHSYRFYAWVGFADPSGRVVASSNGVLGGADVSQRDWFREAAAGRHLFDVHEGLLLAKALAPDAPPDRFFDVAFPVTGEDGRTTGVLAAHVRWSWAADVQTPQLDASVGSSTPAQVLIVSARDEVLFGPADLDKRALGVASVRAAGQGRTGFAVEAWPDGRRYLVGYSPSVGYRESPGLGWRVLVRQDAASALRPVGEVQAHLAAWGVVLVLACSLLGWLGAGPITRPLLRLAEAARGLASGSPVQPGPPGPYREVRMLQDALATGARRIRADADAVAASNARLRDMAERFEQTVISRLEGRQVMLAQELHDSLGATLAGASMLIATARQAPEAARDALLARALDQVRSAAETTRAISRGLLPVGPDPGALVEALEQFVAMLEGAGDVVIELEVKDRLDDIDAAVGQQLYRIVQEAVNNALWHAGARHVEIRLESTDDEDRILVADDGRGFDAARVEADGFGIGIHSMRARARAIGAVIRWDTTPGEGTTVTVRRPRAGGTAPADPVSAPAGPP